MSEPVNHLDPVAAEAVVRQLELLWQQGRRPNPADLLAAAGLAAPAPVAAVLAADQWLRWRAGECVLAEDYLFRHPSVAADPAAALVLVYGEFLVREELGETPVPDDYLRRFPQFAVALRLQLDFHGAVGGGSVESTLVRADDGRTATYFGPGHGGESGPLPAVSGFEIQTELGRGGMGVVYQARQRSLNRVVALKMILSGALAGREQVARFRAETEAVARFQHPNIVQIFEVGESEGRPYCALEYVAGGNLAQKLGGVPQPPADAARLIAVLARAMQCAHEHGIVHRDLKPANVLLAAGGTPKVADFGLARRLDIDSGLTQTEAVMGTPSYMAPEQASGRTKDVGPAADVYALGAILYECLTGHPPFRGATPLDTLEQVRETEPVPVRALQQKVPRDLETVCLKCLHKDPARRYPTAAELAEDLDRFLAGEPVRGRRVGLLERGAKWVRRRPVVSGLLALLVTALSALAVVSIAFTAEQGELRGAAEKQRDYARDQREIAQEQEKLAKEETKRANKKTDELRLALDNNTRELARNTVLLADSAWIDNQAGRALRLLDEVPESERRWDWYYRRQHFDAALFTLHGHNGVVEAVAFSPDGRFLASVGADGTARLWDARTGQPRHTWDLRRGGLRGIRFSPDGRRLAAGALGGLLVWDVQGDRPPLILKGEGGEVFSLAFSKDGRRLAAGLFRGPGQDPAGVKVLVWDAQNGRQQLALKMPAGIVDGVDFSPDGHRLIAGGTFEDRDGKGRQHGEARIWDATSGAELLARVDVPSSYGRIAYGTDGVTLISVSSEFAVRLWDRDLHSYGNFFTHKERLWAGALAPDGQSVAAASDDGTIRLWDRWANQPRAVLRGHDGRVNDLVFRPDGRRLASAGADGTVRLWGDREDSGQTTLYGASALITALAFDRDGKRLAAAGESFAGAGPHAGVVQLWEPTSGRTLLKCEPHAAEVTSLVFSPDGTRVVSGGRDGLVKLWEASTGKVLTTFTGHAGPVLAVAFSPDGHRIASAAGSPKEGPGPGEVKVWDAETGKQLYALRGIDTAVQAVAFGGEAGSMLATSGDQGHLSLWDAATGNAIRRLAGHGNEQVSGLAFSPDGRWLASADVRRFVRLWDVRTGAMERVLSGQSVTSTYLRAWVGFSPDGDRLAAAHNRTVTLWDVRTGQEVLTLRGQTTDVNCAAFSPDGHWLATGGRNTEVRLWDARLSPVRQVFLGHRADVYSASLSPDGGLVAASALDGFVRLWDVRTGSERLVREGLAPDYHRIVFGPGGEWFAARGSNGRGNAWRLPAGELLPAETDLRNGEQRVLTPDGESLLTSSGGHLRLIDLRRPDADEIARRLWVMETEWNQSGADDPASPRVAQKQRLQGNQWAAFYHERQAARIHAEQGRWYAAAAAITRNVGLDPVTLRLPRSEADLRLLSERNTGMPPEQVAASRRELAMVRLAAGQYPLYHRTCAWLLALCQGTDPGGGESAVEDTARACVLHPRGLMVEGGWAALAGLRIDDPVLRAAVLHRAGRHAQALEVLGDDRSPYALLVRALAEHGAKRDDAARQSLRQATDWLDAAPDPALLGRHKDALGGLPWDRRLELALLRQEAESLLQPPK